ncbi:MAG: folate-binding protein, partial [Pseudomonadota bacterium]
MTETRLIDRALIRISSGDPEEDIREFLQGLVTQDMAAVQPGKPQWSALLSAQGKLLFDFILWAEGEDILIDCEAPARDSLVKRLKLYRLRRKISIEADETLAVHWALDMPGKPHDPRLESLGHRWLEANANVSETGGDANWRAHRLSCGIAEGEAELGSEKTLWLECNAAELNGVSFEKGCYVG